MLYSEEEYKLFRDELEGSSIGTLWSAMRGDNFGKKDFSYEDKCDYFLELLHRLLLEGKVKLGNHGEFLHGSVEEQILLFRKRFPNTQDEMDAGAFDGCWFLTEKCPGGIVWIHENGYQDWT
ncbi:DUF596 domain-containing protein [Serratia rubidaea]|uniref:DUF596 domain-containing protein n=1 Tax=Serratia rubidaea TaxID=61652 RepID=A0ABS0MBI6_SERRU|nr:DUF596 domain-containing protein [Serratia rubidaea]MBH1929736.1 DUF596 domain-containing protein [Serratia rubidaea]MEB7588310.1 DUF596 domain-containing protein [Serratia rubidaea]